jgi:hypothetical protein
MKTNNNLSPKLYCENIMTVTLHYIYVCVFSHIPPLPHFILIVMNEDHFPKYYSRFAI